jgi:hypothetical protein
MKNIIAFVFSCLFFSAFAQEVSNQYDKIGRFNQGVAIVWRKRALRTLQRKVARKLLSLLTIRFPDLGKTVLHILGIRWTCWSDQYARKGNRAEHLRQH